MPAAAAADRARLSVAMDATALLDRPTGVGRFCRGALAGLARTPGLDTRAFAVTGRRRSWLPDRVPRGVTVRQRAMPARPLHAAWSRGSWPAVEWFVGRVDVVHGANFVVPPTRAAARVMTVHDLTAVRFPELCDGASLRFPALVRRAAGDGAWVHTPSQAVAAEVVDVLGLDAERVRAVHHGVPGIGDDSVPEPGAASVGPVSSAPGFERYVVAIGTVEPRKDYPGLVAAFERLAGDRPELGLVVVGAPGWGSQSFDLAVERSPYRRRVVRLGYASDEEVDHVLRRASVLAYPSLYEGFGFPPLQAMAAGVPVVATAAGAIPEVVGEAALLVPPRDPDALAGALATVLDDEGGRSALIAAGRARAGAFTWDRCATGLEALYRDAAAAR